MLEKAALSPTNDAKVTDFINTLKPLTKEEALNRSNFGRFSFR